MMNLNYDIIGAELSGEKRNPREVIQSLGITSQHFTLQSVSDKWQFWNCKNVPKELPSFIKEFKLKPKSSIGRKLSIEEIQAIKNMVRKK